MQRNGKWTREEENYAQKLVTLFIDGIAGSDIKAGESLRIYLAKKINSKPTRITKKFGHMQILSMQYQNNGDRKELSNEDRKILDELRDKYLEKDILVQLNRKKRKKYLRSTTEVKKQKTHKKDVNESLEWDLSIDNDVLMQDGFELIWDSIDLDGNESGGSWS
mmetsp:Transcript_27486/g.27706  ORF Transcript_27486/g.27706 Transcript_27486/m.27706 type:complete len:164 (+) Transcript_27486:112-603(+)